MTHQSKFTLWGLGSPGGSPHAALPVPLQTLTPPPHRRLSLEGQVQQQAAGFERGRRARIPWCWNLSWALVQNYCGAARLPAPVGTQGKAAFVLSQMYVLHKM